MKNEQQLQILSFCGYPFACDSMERDPSLQDVAEAVLQGLQQPSVRLAEGCAVGTLYMALRGFKIPQRLFESVSYKAVLRFEALSTLVLDKAREHYRYHLEAEEIHECLKNFYICNHDVVIDSLLHHPNKPVGEFEPILLYSQRTKIRECEKLVPSFAPVFVNPSWIDDLFENPKVRIPPAISLDQIITVMYTNWRGETSQRRIAPLYLKFESNEWHPRKQWIMYCYDADKNSIRGFALDGLLEPEQ
jgi:hypothetical protein